MSELDLGEFIASESPTDESSNNQDANKEINEDGTEAEKQAEDTNLEDKPEEEGNKEKPKNFNEIPRFKELIQQKNDALKDKETTLKEKEQIQNELNELKTKLSVAEKEKSDGNSKQEDFSGFDKVIDTKYPFKKPEEYPDIMSLYADMRAALLKDLTIIDSRERNKVEVQQNETKTSIQRDLDDVETFFAEDKESKDKFLTYAATKYKAGSSMPILDMMELWTDLTKGPEDKPNSNTLSAIGSGKSTAVSTNKEEAYNPRTERSRSMYDLGQEFMQKFKK